MRICLCSAGRKALRSLVICAVAIGSAGGGLAQAAAGSVDSPNRMSDAAIVADLRANLQRLVREDKFSGAVLLAKHGRILFEQAYGDANKTFGVRNAVDTKFNLGSMGKMFTGVAILQLVEEGKLSLDDKLIKDLPNYPNKAVATQITIRQLLTHTSGLGDFFSEKFAETNMAQFNSLESLLPLFVNEPLLFKPGTQWHYSNGGFIVLGLVIQHVSGESYYDYVRQHIFEPAGMVNTGNWPADEVIPNRAEGYTRQGAYPGAPRKSNIFEVQRGGSAGGGYSTVGDLLRFAEALQGDRLLDKKFTDMDMTGQVVTTHPGAKYAFGMEVQRMNGVRIVGHGGGGPGIQSVLDMYPDLGYVVAVMTNYDLAMSRVIGRLRMELTGEPLPSQISLSAKTLQEYVGQYRPMIPQGGQARVTGSPPPIVVSVGASGGDIDVSPGFGREFEFTPQSRDQFFERDYPESRITFLRDRRGDVTSFKTTTGFAMVPPITAKRVSH